MVRFILLKDIIYSFRSCEIFGRYLHGYIIIEFAKQLPEKLPDMNPAVAVCG